MQVARYRERHDISAAESDSADAHVLADIVRTDRHQLLPVAGDSPEAEAVKVLSRVHKTSIWARSRHVLSLRHALLEFFPAELVAACQAWCEHINARVHRETGEAPVDRLALERTRLHPLPDEPHTAALGEERLVYEDQTVRFRSVRYSTPPGHVDTRVWCGSWATRWSSSR
jgi:hypothetical protein